MFANIHHKNFLIPGNPAKSSFKEIIFTIYRRIFQKIFDFQKRLT